MKWTTLISDLQSRPHLANLCAKYFDDRNFIQVLWKKLLIEATPEGLAATKPTAQQLSYPK
jgi:hypothetical protein